MVMAGATRAACWDLLYSLSRGKEGVPLSAFCYSGFLGKDPQVLLAVGGRGLDPRHDGDGWCSVPCGVIVVMVMKVDREDDF